MSIEQLRREVVRAITNVVRSNILAVDFTITVEAVRAAFDAYDKARDAANKPTFEGDEAPMINEQEVRHLLRSSGTELDRQALALLDAKDERLASAAKWNDLYANARDEALARAERAEQALADRDAAIVEVTNRAAEWKHTGNCCTSTANYVVEPLRPFLPAPEPAVDPLRELAVEMVLADGVIRTGNQEQAIRDGRAAQEAVAEHERRLRAAIERAGGVKAVFGEGL